jgi:thiol-disulfide isomerase/thioredoxin
MFEGLKAPEIEATGWLNSPPLRLKDLRERVALLHIWDYTCANCLRDLPVLAEWQRRYSPLGLVIVAVHCPEFDFGRDSRNVERALRRFGIEYAVALDNDFRVWNAYANRYWPRTFLIDRRGVIRHDQIGEGNWRRTEEKIQELLGELSPALSLPQPLEEEGSGVSYPTTAELYTGYQRGRLGNPEGYRPNQVIDYREMARCVDGHLYLRGQWLNLAHCLQHASRDRGDWIGLRYHAVSVNAVISTVGWPSVPLEVELRQDGRSLCAEAAGEDVIVEGGRSFVVVEHPRTYQLVANPRFGYHILRLYTGSELFRLHAFTFGGRLERSERRLTAASRGRS